MPSLRDRNVRKLARMKKRAKVRIKAKLDEISSGKPSTKPEERKLRSYIIVD